MKYGTLYGLLIYLECTFFVKYNCVCVCVCVYKTTCLQDFVHFVLQTAIYFQYYYWLIIILYAMWRLFSFIFNITVDWLISCTLCGDYLDKWPLFLSLRNMHPVHTSHVREKIIKDSFSVPWGKVAMVLALYFYRKKTTGDVINITFARFTSKNISWHPFLVWLTYDPRSVVLSKSPALKMIGAHNHRMSREVCWPPHFCSSTTVASTRQVCWPHCSSSWISVTLVSVVLTWCHE